MASATGLLATSAGAVFPAARLPTPVAETMSPIIGPPTLVGRIVFFGDQTAGTGH